MNAAAVVVVATILLSAPALGCNEAPERKSATTETAGPPPPVAAPRSSEPRFDPAKRASDDPFAKVRPKISRKEVKAVRKSTDIRRFNAFFENEEQANTSPANLQRNRTYQLIAYIGERHQSGLFDAEEPSQTLTAVLQRKVTSRLNIVIDCEFCSQAERHQVQGVSLPADGESDHARFKITPVRPTASSKEDYLVMRIEEDQQVIQSFIARVRITLEEDASQSSKRATPKLAKGDGDIVGVASAPKEPVAAKAYLASSEIDLSPPPLRPDLVIEFETTNRKIIFSGPVVKGMPGAPESLICDGVGERDYESLATEVVNRLYDMRQRSTFRFDENATESMRYVKLSDVSRRDVLGGFARLGNAMYRQLFGSSPRALNVLSALRKIPGSPRVYIKSPNGYLPWALMYDGPAGKLSPEQVDPEAFWGSRYILVGIPLDRIEQRPIARDLKFVDLSLLLGFYAGDETPFPTYRTMQREYWLKPGRPAPLGESLSEDDLLNRLHQVSKTMSTLYVYAHGENGMQTVEAKYKDSNQIVRFSRPDPAGATIRLSPLRFLRVGLKPDDIVLLNIDDARLTGALVFLNVCNGESTGAVSQRNFVPAFLSVGAGAVIATDAEMDQGVAAAFGQDFFDEIASRGGETTIAEIMFVLRRKYLPHNPLVYAYTLWGNGTVKREKATANVK